MSTPLVIPLTQIRQTDVAQVGGKAAPLGDLLAAGFPVPAGVCVTTAAFQQALAEWQAPLEALLQQTDWQKPLVCEQVADAVAQQLTALQIPPALTTALQALLPALVDENKLWAVRSSATAEDSVAASYAGQYVTKLGARGMAGVQQAILDCWRSFFSANALLARARHNALAPIEGMGVLIQPLILAECAGVCFSVDPVQHRCDLLVVNAAWGLGIGVVDGVVAADTAWVQRENFRAERQQIREKPVQMGLTAAGNLELMPVVAERQRAACLPEEWLERVTQFAVAAAVKMGAPQDVEWAIAGNHFWLLQSRPLTALPPELARPTPFPVIWTSPAEAQLLWQRPPKDEAPELLLPLEQNLVIQLEEGREEACRILGVERNQAAKYCNGHVYTRPLPMRWTAADRRVRRTAMLDLHTRLQEQGLTTWDYWGPEIVKATERLHAFNHVTTEGPALAEHLQEALAVSRRHYILHPMMVFKPAQAYFAAYSVVAGVTKEQAEREAWCFLEGEATPLTQLIDQIYTLAQLAHQTPAIAVLLQDEPTTLLTQWQAAEAATITTDTIEPFFTQLTAFMTRYGERTGAGWGSEGTLRTRTWREQPLAVLQFIAAYLDPNLEAPANQRLRTRQVRNQGVEMLCAACTDEAAVVEFRRQLAYARKVGAVLELHNHYIDQLSSGQLRRAVMTAAAWLVARGALPGPDDVLWLSFDEIVEALHTDQPAPFTTTLAERQAEYAQWLTLDAPPILGIPDARLPDRPPLQDEVTPEPASDHRRLLGQGASPGQGRGPARLAANALALPELAPGAILVAENIGPLWTPLFPRLGGLVLEGGAMGQHAAATAREYGVPAVIRVKNARQRIPDGAWITLDGTTGIVGLDNIE
ncbi:MAG: PEP/pyruvate-binding domain-containing protein [Caldilineaceae bacterium]